jgi:hypothetical protein
LIQNRFRQLECQLNLVHVSYQDEISRVILELQKERFFEDLTAKYWNASLKGSCLRNDDSEGITLESLGGVFIATLVGLGEFLSPASDFFQ